MDSLRDSLLDDFIYVSHVYPNAHPKVVVRSSDILGEESADQTAVAVAANLAA